MKKILILLMLLTSALYGLNPGRAMLYSAFIPGGGQVYNRQYLKAGLVVGVEGYLLYSILAQDAKVKDYKSKLNKELDGWQYQQYLDKRDESRERRTSDIWWLGIARALSVIDAFVDAHLADFESERDKLHLEFNSNGVQLQYRF